MSFWIKRWGNQKRGNFRRIKMLPLTERRDPNEISFKPDELR